MAWQVYGVPLETADMSGVTPSQTFTLNSRRLIVAARAWISLYNDPVFTNVYAEIRANAAGTASTVIATSAVLTKAQVLTLDNGVKEVPFVFATPPGGIPLNGTDTYHFLVRATGYTGDASSHIAWRKDWPVPRYGDYTPNAGNANTSPYDLTLIGAEY